MGLETHCAELLRLLEGEEILAVGEDVARKLNPSYERERRAGAAKKLPDLWSTKRAEGVYRLREVKFKLHDALVRKALKQLRSGARQLRRHVPRASIDRIEIVVPRGARGLKPPEREFLGRALGVSRYRLRLDGAAVSLRFAGKRVPVTVLVV